MQRRSVRSWTSVDKDDALSYLTIAKSLDEFKDSQLAFEDSPWTDPTSAITTDQNIQALQRIGMRNRQISVRRLLYELPIPTTTVYEIISNHLGMREVSTRWVPNTYLTLSRESEGNSNNYFLRIVTGDEICLYYYQPFSQEEAKVWKKAYEETTTRLRRRRPAEKIIMDIFWDQCGIFLTDYLPRGNMISSLSYASIIERLRHCVIVEKRGDKVSDGVVLLHDNVSIRQCNIVQTAIGKSDFVELNDHAYAADIAPSDCQIWIDLFVRRILVAMKKQSILLKTLWINLI